jgi:hypothetical protein
MSDRVTRLVLVSTILLVSGCATSRPPAAAPAAPAAPDNEELLELYQQDQADRKAGAIDGKAVVERDAQREKRVRELLDAGEVKTGGDYHHAALVFQHAGGVEGIQLAHELAMIGASLGDRSCRWLAAASYDRLMVRLGQKQRFATQYGRKGEEPFHLDPVDTDERCVTDSMRAALDCPTLARAKEREAQMQSMFPPSKPAASSKPD